MAAPAREVDAVGPDLLGHGDGVLALPLAGMPTPDHERARSRELRTGAGERADQRGDALEPEEPADEEQHRGVVVLAEQPVEVGLGVGQRARRTRLAPPLRVFDEEAPERLAPTPRRAGPRCEALDVHPVRQGGDVLGFDPEHGDRGIPVLGRHGDEVIGELRLVLQVCGPELAVPPGVPTGCAQHLRLLRVEVAGPGIEAIDVVGHGRERLAERGRERDAVSIASISFISVPWRCTTNGTSRPVSVHGVELRGEVVEMEQVGVVGAGSPERLLPHRGQMLGELGRHRGEHHVRDSGAVFVRGMHRRRSGDRVAARLERADRVGGVEEVDVEAVEERRGVGLLPRRRRATRPRARPTSPPGPAPGSGSARRTPIRPAGRRAAPSRCPVLAHPARGGSGAPPAPRPGGGGVGLGFCLGLVTGGPIAPGKPRRGGGGAGGAGGGVGGHRVYQLSTVFGGCLGGLQQHRRSRPSLGFFFVVFCSFSVVGVVFFFFFHDDGGVGCDALF